MTHAVVVIDVQQGLCDGQYAAYNSQAVIARINVVTKKARAAKMPIVLIQHITEIGFLQHGSSTWELAQGLDVQAQDLRIQKTTPDSFLHTTLESVLRERGVTNLVICGMHTEFCVDTTTRRAMALGFSVTLISDAHSTMGNSAITPEQVIAHHNATLPNIKSFGPRVTLATAESVSFDTTS
jgi:nicotinamidase-related amidase